MKRMNLVFAVAAAVAVIISFGGCKSSKQQAYAPAPQAGQPPMNAAPAGVALSGKVVETMNSGGYTYVQLENSGNKIWVAVPLTQVKVGQEVKCQPGMEMVNFTSKTLNRTFASIIFSGGLI